ncbi:MAG TPA: CBS domain-containing protein [Gammaproteobacteria bacterium]|nr:CBS domain-containing protein [Gammaproteobacteria bacterium]
MIVGNWMQSSPATVTSDTLVADAERILAENSLNALPVVDGDGLRGLLTRASCLRAHDFVTRKQDPHEFDFLVNRLKVRDLMVRTPETVRVDDTMEHCLRKGQALGIGQFPVMDGDRLAGLISATEVFRLASRFLGAFEQWSGLTLSLGESGHGTVGRIAAIVDGTGAVLHSIYPLHGPEDDHPRRLVVRFESDDLQAVVDAFEGAGYEILEAEARVQTAHA